MIKAVFFDFDGVLTLDKTGSHTTCKYISKKTESEYNLIISCYKKFNKKLNMGKLTHEDIWRDFCDCIGKEIDLSILHEAFESTPANEAMFSLARKLKANYKVGIITDNKKDRFDVVKRKLNLDQLFDVLIVSSDLGAVKDSEEIFKEAINNAEVKPEECIFIDNKRENLVIPSKLGINAIFYDDEKNDTVALIKELKILGVNL